MTDIAQLGFSVDSAPLKTAARDLDHMASSTQKADKAVDELGDAAKTAGTKINTGLTPPINSSTKATEQMQKTAEAANKNTGRLGHVAQQAGFQVGDFAVQVGAGQSALVAFSQQGTQLLGIFGPAGAIAGAILAIGSGLAGYFIPEMLKSEKATDALANAMGRLDTAASDSSEGVSEITNEIRRLAQVSEIAARARIVSAMQDATEASQIAGKAIAEALGLDVDAIGLDDMTSSARALQAYLGIGTGGSGDYAAVKAVKELGVLLGESGSAARFAGETVAFMIANLRENPTPENFLKLEETLSKISVTAGASNPKLQKLIGNLSGIFDQARSAQERLQLMQQTLAEGFGPPDEQADSVEEESRRRIDAIVRMYSTEDELIAERIKTIRESTLIEESQKVDLIARIEKAQRDSAMKLAQADADRLKKAQEMDQNRAESVIASLDDEVQAVKRSFSVRAAIIKASTTLQENEKRAIILRLAEKLEDDLANIAEKSGEKSGDDFASPWAGVSDQIASDLQTAITRGDWQGIGASIGGALAGGISRSVTQGLTSAIGESLGAAGGLVAGIGGAVAGGIIGGILQGSTTKVVAEWMQFNLSGLMLDAAELVKTRRTSAFGSSTRVASRAISDAITAQITNSLVFAASDLERNLQALGADIGAGLDEFEFSARAENPAEFLEMAAEEYARQALAAATIYQRSGETLNQTVARLAEASGAVSTAFRALGTNLSDALSELDFEIRVGIQSQIAATEKTLDLLRSDLEILNERSSPRDPNIRERRDLANAIAIEEQNLAFLLAQLADATNAAGIAVEQGLIESIVNLTGVSSTQGVQELERLTDAFEQMAFTAEELAQRDIADARETLRNLGIDGLDASADVATLSQQLRDLRGGSTETSAELLVAAGAVLSLSDATERLEGAAGSATSSVASLLSALSADTDRAFGRLQASVSAEQKALRDSASAEIDAIRAQTQARLEANRLASDAAREGLRAIEREVSGIQSATASLRNELDPIQTARRQTAIARLARALETGDLTGAGDAADLAARINAEQYTNSADYQREQARTLFLLSSLEMEGQEQLSTAEQAIQRLDRQAEIIQAEGDRAIQAAQERLDAELAKLDEQLATSRMQIDALRGIDQSILSVADAIRMLAGALGKEMPTAIEQAYRTIAGRDPDPEGFEWWQNAFRTGTATMADLEYALRQETGEIPMFANGGSFGGGLRVVGERGAELEMTGASRIMSNADLMRALGANMELANEMRAMHSDMMIGLNQLAKNTHKTSKQLERWDLTGLPEDRVIA